MLAKQGAVRLLLPVFIFCVAVSCTPATRAPDDAALVRTELQKPHTQAERAALLNPKALSSIGRMATIAGLEPEPVIGFGLVTGLGAAGSDKAGVSGLVLQEVRKNLMREETRTVEESKEMVLSLDSSIVEVRAAVPAGANIGDTLDVFVRSIDSAMSLEDGYLHTVPLAPYVSRERQVTRGATVAKVSGEIATGVEAGGSFAAGSGGRSGVIFDGGRCESARFLWVRLEDKYVSGRRAVLIEHLINSRFSGLGVRPGGQRTTYALALSDKMVRVFVPPVYGDFVGRFADLLKCIEGDWFYGPPSDSEFEDWLRRLEEGTPEEKYLASVRLEAVGSDARPYLERAAGDDWTLLYSGQALACLGGELDPTRIIAASDSSVEEVRYEAVKLLSRLPGRSAAQALRARVFDPSERISLQAVEGLVRQGEEYAVKRRMAGYDIFAIKGVAPALIVQSTGRPKVVITGIGTPLEGTVEVRVDAIGLGSTDATHVGVISARGAEPQEQIVMATVDNIIAVLVMYEASFSEMRRIIAALEDAGNIPYKITWID